MYTDFYQFLEKPFEDNPDPKFLYLTPSYKEALASILTWIREGDGFSVITGEAGTGKTYFIHTLVNLLGDKVKPIIFLYPMTFQEILKQIFLELNPPLQEKTRSAFYQQLTTSLDQLATEDKTLLLIFDEAQSLDDKTLESIWRFLNLKPQSIRIIFVGQPYLDKRLHSISLSRLEKRIKIKYQMKSFSEVESRGYIDHRLRLVGSTSQIFTPKAISMICTYSQGVPSLINHVCDNAFRLGFIKKQEEIDIDTLEEVILNLSGPKGEAKNTHSFTARPIPWFPIPFLNTSKRISIALLLSVFLLGGFFLLYEYLGQRSIKIEGITSFIQRKLAMKPLAHSPSAEGKIEKMLTKDRTSPSEELKPPEPEPFSLHRDPIDLASNKEKQKPSEVIITERGECLLALAKKYYHRTNPTLIALILEHNPEITNANLILLNQKIRLPKITEELLIMQFPEESYKIHLGTFRDSNSVQFYKNEPLLEGKAVEAFPQKISPHETWYRVVAGPFGHKEECLKVIAQLKENGLLPIFEVIRKAQ